MPKTVEAITVETLYKKVVKMQRDIVQIKKSLLKEPELREKFIRKMKDIDLEKSIMIRDFGKRYGLKQCINFPYASPRIYPCSH